MRIRNNMDSATLFGWGEVAMITSAILTPFRLGPLELRNRIVKCATYETLTRDGLVTDVLIDWHREIAAWPRSSGTNAIPCAAHCSASAPRS